MRTIFAMGGGGFTMELDSTVLDEYILGLARRPVPPRLLPADGERRPARPHHALLRGVLRPGVRADRPVALPPRPPPGRPAAASVRAGHRLRRRGVDAKHARDLAGARARRDPARMLGA